MHSTDVAGCLQYANKPPINRKSVIGCFDLIRCLCTQTKVKLF